MSKNALETVKVNIDHIALKIENLQHCDRGEAMLALEHAAASLSYSQNQKMGDSAAFSSYNNAFMEQHRPANLRYNPSKTLVVSSVGKVSSSRDDRSNKHQCETCAKSFPTNFKLRRHQKTGAGCDRILKQQIGSIKCTHCDYRTTSKDNLEDHLVKHSGKFQCPVCNHQFSRNYKLQNHIKNPDNCMKYMNT